MSEKEKTAKEIGGKAAKHRDDELGFAAQFPSNQAGDKADSYQGKYGSDYFTGTAAHKHAQDLEIKAKALHDIRKIYHEQVGALPEPQATVTVTDSDVAAYKAFLDLEYLRDFDLFTGEKFLKEADPAQIKWINDIYPDIFQRRIEEIEKILNVQKKVAMINILGPRSKEDLMFMYELELMATRDKSKLEAILHKSVAEQVGTGDKEKKVRGFLSSAKMFSNFPTIDKRDKADTGTYLNNLGTRREKFDYSKPRTHLL